MRFNAIQIYWNTRMDCRTRKEVFLSVYYYPPPNFPPRTRKA